MPRVVVPAGFPLGPRYQPAGGERPPEFEIGLGDAAILLGRQEMLVLTAARATPELQLRREVTVARLTDSFAGPNATVGDPHAVLDRLLSDGLLVEFDPAGEPIDDLAAVFRRYRLLPLAEGRGATPEEPRRYRIGHDTTTVAVVDTLTYLVWAYGRAATDLWSQCCTIAAEATGRADAASTGPQHDGRAGLTPADVARAVARNLPVLVSAGCAYLDLAVGVS
jgi:hypothetical protein